MYHANHGVDIWRFRIKVINENTKYIRRNSEYRILVERQKLDKKKKEFEEWALKYLLLSQLGRPQKGVTSKEPQLDGLRESGDIEQDADMVLLSYIDLVDGEDTDIDRSGIILEQMRKVREVLDNLDLSPKARKIFSFKFSEWEGKDDPKNLYDICNGVLKLIKDKLNNRELF